MKAKRSSAKPARSPSGSAKRKSANNAVSSGVTSARKKTGPKEARVTQAPFGNSFRLLVQRVDRIDWRYKVQLTIGISLAIIIATYLLRDRIFALGSWGYLGAFIVSGISNATIILPAPGGAVIAIMAQDFNPLLIGIAAGLGGTIGGSTAYIAGHINGGSARNTRWFNWLKRIMGRIGGIVIFTFALIPFFPGDLASLIAGGVRYPFRRYLLYTGLASMIKMTVIAYVGSDFLRWLETIFNEWVRTVL